MFLKYFEKTEESQIDSKEKKERHIIKNIPYVSQETKFYCSYACPTMIFKYYGINTSLSEILFNSGVGFFLVYPPLYVNYVPVSGTIGSQWSVDRKFLAKLYGFSYESWRASSKLSDDKRWQEYWTKIKQYLMKNSPVQTAVNQNYLPRFRFGSWVISKLILKFFPPSIHDIIIVGFDENKKKVCYHDPQYGTLRGGKNGEYIWVNLDTLKKAISTAKIGEKESNYSIEVFNKITNLPLSRKEIFIKAHKRNIQKMKGDPEVYDKRYHNRGLGVNALINLKNDLKIGMEKNSNNFLKTKQMELKLHILHKIHDLFFNQSNHNVIFSNIYGNIASEKQYVFKFLKENDNLSSTYRYDRQLIESEIGVWMELDRYFSLIKKKKLSNRKADTSHLIKNMINEIDKAINIENKIING